ncbi:uncharacterized protein BXZ73DRAFT_100698 [Epithele typhae]|uniref:uncharacterized protein n=1 Tax=Epithele typhae TaxID=378194 RepID=UPI0020081D51|nr:uncharacterized protein BXZ73DRAFT_100698 [Epithele typhae]KAH9934508.1 hypothetical protein BXZ73DRAFT_100698 [Epithele typhae]
MMYRIPAVKVITSPSRSSAPYNKAESSFALQGESVDVFGTLQASAPEGGSSFLVDFKNPHFVGPSPPSSPSRLFSWNGTDGAHELVALTSDADIAIDAFQVGLGPGSLASSSLRSSVTRGLARDTGGVERAGLVTAAALDGLIVLALAAVFVALWVRERGTNRVVSIAFTPSSDLVRAADF